MTTELLTLKTRLEELIEQHAQDVEQLQQEQIEVRRIKESLTSDTLRAMAYDQGRIDERNRTVALINTQLDALQKTGMNAISLRTLRRHILNLQGDADI